MKNERRAKKSGLCEEVCVHFFSLPFPVPLPIVYLVRANYPCFELSEKGFVKTVISGAINMVAGGKRIISAIH